MIKKLEIPIREFVYFDREKVEDFVSSIQGGLPEKRRQVKSNKSGSFGVGIKAWFLNLVRRGGAKELTWEEIQSETNASLFEWLHNLLDEKEAIINIEDFSETAWGQIEEGEFIEFQGRTEYSALEKFFDTISSLIPFIQSFSPTQFNTPDSQNIVNLVQVYKKKSHNVRILPLGAPTDKYTFVASLPEEKTRTNKDELAENYTVFGRIKKKLGERENYELFNLLPEGITLPKNQIQSLIENFKSMPPELGAPPRMGDLVVNYPAIILTPIAIYR